MNFVKARQPKDELAGHVKKLMERLTIMFFLCLLISCTKDKPFTNTGVITGPDVRTCSCCGGLYFHFTDIADTTNKPLMNPGIFQFTNDVKYPVNVKVDWEKTTFCGGYAIKIKNFKLL
jgi:hypothetical protein